LSEWRQWVEVARTLRRRADGQNRRSAGQEPSHCRQYGECQEGFIPAIELESQVWNEVSALMKAPYQLTADLERMIELERQDNRGDPDREAKVWLDKITELDQESRGCLRLAARGRMSDEDLDEALAELEEAQNTAQRDRGPKASPGVDRAARARQGGAARLVRRCSTRGPRFAHARRAAQVL
jgi:hypothetical protein